MATTAHWYGKGMLHVMSDVNVTLDTIKVALTTSSYTPNQDVDEVFSDISNEVTGTGYTAGGRVLTSVAISYTAGTNTVAIDCDDITWATSTITARRAVFYKWTGTASTSPLIGWQDAGSDQSSSGGNFVFLVAAGGFVNSVVA